MYTTSRYASGQARTLAKRMAGEHGEKYVARGKKTVRELAESARRRGDGCVCIVSDGGRGAAGLSCMEVLCDGGWKWKERKELKLL